MPMQTTQAPKRHLHTIKDYDLMAQAGILRPDDRTELIEGEIIDMAPIGSRHAGTVKKLICLFQSTIGDQAILSVQDPIRLGELSQPQPDIALLKPKADFYRDAHPQAGDVLLIVEVADASLDYDRSTKLALYARHAIPEVWLVDLTESRLERWRQPQAGQYRQHDEPPGPISPVRLPDCRIEIQTLF